MGPIVLLAKVIVLLFFMIWVRATLPRIRYDRLMSFGWKLLFPLGLVERADHRGRCRAGSRVDYTGSHPSGSLYWGLPDGTSGNEEVKNVT